MIDKTLKGALAVSVIILGSSVNAASQESGEQAPENIHIECAADPHYRREALKKIRHASKHLLNRKLSAYGGAKKLKVKLHRCQTSVLDVGNSPRLGVIDASYEITWRKKNFFDRTTYFLVLDALIESDGTAANFKIIDASHTLNPDLVRSFPIQTQYFNSYND